jgi:hypothetical protein
MIASCLAMTGWWVMDDETPPFQHTDSRTPPKGGNYVAALLAGDCFVPRNDGV